MGQQALFERVVKLLQEAAFDDKRWPVVSRLMDELCEVKGNLLVMGDGDATENVNIYLANFCFRGQRHPELEREYFDVYHGVDERLPRLRRLRDGLLVTEQSLFSDEEKRTSAVYRFLDDNNKKHGLLARIDALDGARIVWGLGDPVKGTDWSNDQIKKAEMLVPHIRQFGLLRQALADAGAQRAGMSRLLDSLNVGVIWLDRNGRVAAANDRALGYLRDQDGLSEKDGRLCATTPEEDERFRNILGQAVPRSGSPGVGRSMVISRTASMFPLVLHLSPIHEKGMDMPGSRLGALALVVEPSGQTAIDPRLIMELLGLTRAESEVVALLAHGLPARAIAERTGRSLGTVQWHTKRIFAKLGISRQFELVQLVNTLIHVPEIWLRRLN